MWDLLNLVAFWVQFGDIKGMSAWDIYDSLHDDDSEFYLSVEFVRLGLVCDCSMTGISSAPSIYMISQTPSHAPLIIHKQLMECAWLLLLLVQGFPHLARPLAEGDSYYPNTIIGACLNQIRSLRTTLQLKSNQIAKRRLYKAYRCTRFIQRLFHCCVLSRRYSAIHVSHGLATLISDAWVWQVITIRLQSQLASHRGACHVWRHTGMYIGAIEH